VAGRTYQGPHPDIATTPIKGIYREDGLTDEDLLEMSDRQINNLLHLQQLRYRAVMGITDDQRWKGVPWKDRPAHAEQPPVPPTTPWTTEPAD
jgi:hypothetical protein